MNKVLVVGGVAAIGLAALYLLSKDKSTVPGGSTTAYPPLPNQDPDPNGAVKFSPGTKPVIPIVPPDETEENWSDVSDVIYKNELVPKVKTLPAPDVVREEITPPQVFVPPSSQQAGVEPNVPSYLATPQTEYVTPYNPPVVPAPTSNLVAQNPISIPASNAPINKFIYNPDGTVKPGLKALATKLNFTVPPALSGYQFS